MNNSTLKALLQPEAKSTDPLTDLLRAGARDLIAQAVEAELQALLGKVRTSIPRTKNENFSHLISMGYH